MRRLRLRELTEVERMAIEGKITPIAKLRAGARDAPPALPREELGAAGQHDDARHHAALADAAAAVST